MISAFWLAEDILSQTVQNFEIENDWCFLKSLRANVMQINIMQMLQDHMSRLSFSTNKVIVSEACELSQIKQKKPVRQKILYACY